MDGVIHIITGEMFYQVLRHGNDFPVVWLDGFGNYGMPVGIFAHQITAYLSAGFIFLVQNPVLANNIVCFIGLLLSNIFFYIFLRIYLPQTSAFLAVFLLNLAPYRIINIYIRGATPEIFSNIFLPLIMLILYFLVKKKSIGWLLGLALVVSLTALTHPMALVIYSFIFIPYFFFLILVQDGSFSLHNLRTNMFLRLTVGVVMAFIIGVALAAYYLIPLSLEIKYFYYGLSKNHLKPDQYLDINNYINTNWYYFTRTEIFTRGHVIKSGLIETIGIITGVLIVISKIARKKSHIYFSFFDFVVLVSLILIFFTTQYSEIFYANINILSQIQFPWRMLSAFIFLPPIIFGFINKKINNPLFLLLFIFFVCVIRFPQLYGKNYLYQPRSSYNSTINNPHSLEMNTIWTERTQDYKVEKNKIEIIGGEGKVQSREVKNSERIYQLKAETPLTLVDHTFYFPGWHVYVDGNDTPIEFQNPLYRGVITYSVPSGEHKVVVKFEDTKIRTLGKYITLVSIFIIIILFLIRSRLKIYIFGRN